MIHLELLGVKVLLNAPLDCGKDGLRFLSKPGTTTRCRRWGARRHGIPMVVTIPLTLAIRHSKAPVTTNTETTRYFHHHQQHHHRQHHQHPPHFHLPIPPITATISTMMLTTKVRNSNNRRMQHRPIAQWGGIPMMMMTMI